MPNLLSAARAAVLAAALLACPGAGRAASDLATFDFYVSGIHVGKMSLATTQTPTAYTSKSRIEAAGVVGLLLTFFYDGQSSGQIAADGTVVPVRFEAHSKTPRTDRRSAIDWQDGTPVKVSVNPPRKKAPDPAEQAGTLDPVSAGFAILRDRPRDQLCDKTLMVFDGSRLSRLRLDPAKDRDGAITCAGNYARVEGEAHSLSNQREFPFQLVFSQQPNGDGRLERIETDTSFGRAVLERRS
jgi:hypothetical protein